MPNHYTDIFPQKRMAAYLEAYHSPEYGYFQWVVPSDFNAPRT